MHKIYVINMSLKSCRMIKLQSVSRANLHAFKCALRKHCMGSPCLYLSIPYKTHRICTNPTGASRPMPSGQWSAINCSQAAAVLATSACSETIKSDSRRSSNVSNAAAMLWRTQTVDCFVPAADSNNHYCCNIRSVIRL